MVDKIFYLILILTILNPIPQAPASNFRDLPSDYWAFEVIENLSQLGIVKGYPEGTFRPEARLTRAEFAKIYALSFHLSLPESPRSSFVDLPPDHWAIPFIEACVQEGVIKGYPEGYFLPENQVTLEEVLAVLLRHLYPRYEVIPDVEAFPTLDTDRWSYPYIQMALALGILPRDDPDFLEWGEFIPDSPCSRAQACFLVFRTRFFGNSLSLGNPVEYRLTYTVHLFNEGTSPSGGVDLTLATVPDVLPFQHVQEMNFFPQPNEFETDDNGNRFAIFHLEGILPGKEKEVKMEVLVEVFPFSYYPDSETGSLKYHTSGTDFIRFTSPESFEESDSPEVQKKARELDQGEGFFETSLAIYNFVGKHLTYSGYNPQSSGALEALLSGEGDCTEFADLFVALERASGIPSRFVEGFVYSDWSGKREDITHDWAEVRLPGGIWLQVDPTFGRFGENFFFASEGKHILLTRGRNLEQLGGFHYYFYHYDTGGGLASIDSYEEIEIIPQEVGDLTGGWGEIKLYGNEVNFKKVVN
ncbi:MAG: S-layer homology domain-containing protein [Caldiserica bacterium]|nr:S-layer homology domain-containing protein [Caldisericota bacterium]MDH7562449.1 S-layer homology domain-containing protein [Caldisericota bacterium]